jgi:hypothetical protein
MAILQHHSRSSYRTHNFNSGRNNQNMKETTRLSNQIKYFETRTKETFLSSLFLASELIFDLQHLLKMKHGIFLQTNPCLNAIAIVRVQ